MIYCAGTRSFVYKAIVEAAFVVLDRCGKGAANDRHDLREVFEASCGLGKIVVL